MTRTFAFVLSLCAFGCYTFEPMALEEIRPQMEVRARLTPDQAAEFSDLFPGQDRLLEGTVLEGDRNQLLLLVPVATANRRGRLETLNQRLGIPHSGLVEVELKQIDRWRTGALSAAGAAVLGLIVYNSLSGGSSGTTPGGGGGGPQDSWIPIRIPVGW
jgi:hypothetical protein